MTDRALPGDSVPGPADRATASRTALAGKRRARSPAPGDPVRLPPGAAVDPIGCRAAIADHGDAAATHVLVPIPRIPLTEQLIGLELGLSHVTVVGRSRDIDSAVRERSDRLVAAEVLPVLRSP